MYSKLYIHINIYYIQLIFENHQRATCSIENCKKVRDTFFDLHVERCANLNSTLILYLEFTSNTLHITEM